MVRSCKVGRLICQIETKDFPSKVKMKVGIDWWIHEKFNSYSLYLHFKTNHKTLPSKNILFFTKHTVGNDHTFVTFILNVDWNQWCRNGPNFEGASHTLGPIIVGAKHTFLPPLFNKISNIVGAAAPTAPTITKPLVSINLIKNCQNSRQWIVRYGWNTRITQRTPK